MSDQLRPQESICTPYVPLVFLTLRNQTRILPDLGDCLLRFILAHFSVRSQPRLRGGGSESTRKGSFIVR